MSRAGTKQTVILVSALIAFTGAALAVELRTETIDAFNTFVAAVEMRLDPRFIGQHFLWSDEAPGVRQQLLKGSVIAQPVVGNGIIPLKGGLIQDWRGAVFIPHATLRDVLSVAQDFDHHQDFYKPDIESARIESRQGDEFLVFMRIVKSKFLLSDVLNTEQAIQFKRLDPQRVYSRTYSRRISEVASPGRSAEHELPVGQDRGLLWRLNGYWFYEERDDGVYVTCESITLTRDIPFGMAALLGPVIHDLPGDAIRKSLEQTRKAVLDQNSSFKPN
jgi:hypothetical protein